MNSTRVRGLSHDYVKQPTTQWLLRATAITLNKRDYRADISLILKCIVQPLVHEKLGKLQMYTVLLIKPDSCNRAQRFSFSISIEYDGRTRANAWSAIIPMEIVGNSLSRTALKGSSAANGAKAQAGRSRRSGNDGGEIKPSANI